MLRQTTSAAAVCVTGMNEAKYIATLPSRSSDQSERCPTWFCDLSGLLRDRQRRHSATSNTPSSKSVSRNAGLRNPDASTVNGDHAATQCGSEDVCSDALTERDHSLAARSKPEQEREDKCGE
jgi:hypothetical protein